MKIIAAVNGLVASEMSALYALRYAALYGYTLTLLHIKNPSDNIDEVENSMTVIEEAAADCELKTERVFLTGNPVKMIRGYLNEVRTDTLFCSTRMRRTFFENSLSEKLSRLALPANLAVVRVARVDSLAATTDIILPIMADRLSVKKFVFFSSMVRAFTATAEIYSISLTGKRKMANMDIGATRDFCQKINERLDHYGQNLKLMNIPFRIKHAIAGSEVDQLLHHLSHQDFQLMIIGGRRLSRFTGLFRESPLERIFRYTPINTIAFYARGKG
ncbi:MAG: universal stress protein [Proteobacteria bacterium]|nr:universal stress protein [Pseudomonadota bacterium]MBU1715841.1 universal stress protein [Pseudomonadota bacterium]